MVTAEQIERYRRDGFVHVPGLIRRDEALAFREAALAHSRRGGDYNGSAIFSQFVNVWTRDEEMKRLTLDSRIGQAAEALAGAQLRLWHDQILIKQPQNKAATEFHQDQPYWPHDNSPNPISCWIALGDVPVEAGCMTFLPGSQLRTDLPAQTLSDRDSLFGICPDLVWSERVTVPLKAGDVTFHHGRCAHMATPNETDSPRVAHVAIFMDAGTTFAGRGHVVTDPLGLSLGAPLIGELFPRGG